MNNEEEEDPEKIPITWWHLLSVLILLVSAAMAIAALWGAVSTILVLLTG